jgi:hypothetical protein
MERDAWVMAASLLDQLGTEALAAVSRKLDALERAVNATWSPDDAAALVFWRETGKALIAILDAKPAGPHSVN